MRSYQQGLEKEEESDEEDETGNSRVKQGRKESCLYQYEDDAEDENDGKRNTHKFEGK